MSDQRTPVKDEEWSSDDGYSYICMCDTPDSHGQYLWAGEGNTYCLSTLNGMRPPVPKPPEWLGRYWVNVYPDDGERVTFTAIAISDAEADHAASEHRIGRVSLAGEWVPCNGKDVLT